MVTYFKKKEAYTNSLIFLGKCSTMDLMLDLMPINQDNIHYRIDQSYFLKGHFFKHSLAAKQGNKGFSPCSFFDLCLFLPVLLFYINPFIFSLLAVNLYLY